MHSTHGFAVQTPSGWTVEEPKDESIALQVVGERGKFMIFVYDRKRRSLKAVRLPMRHHVVMKMDGKLLADKPARVAGLSAWRLDYLARSNTEEPKRFTRTFFVSGDKLYILHGVAEPAQFAAVAPAFEQMVRSFRPEAGFVLTPEEE
ncbi:MAG: hypothetical protein HY319_04390 [Armatimonadetes bacterium]|nr:hypothetical protein [Armatimonadota bacterium]